MWIDIGSVGYCPVHGLGSDSLHVDICESASQVVSVLAWLIHLLVSGEIVRGQCVILVLFHVLLFVFKFILSIVSVTILLHGCDCLFDLNFDFDLVSWKMK